MNTTTAIKTAEILLLNNGDLIQFSNCLADNTEQKIKALYHRGLNNPKLKKSLIELGFWSTWESQFSNQSIH